MSLQELQEYLDRWKKHENIIKVLEKSDLNKDEVKIWKNQINLHFASLIKSKL